MMVQTLSVRKCAFTSKAIVRVGFGRIISHYWTFDSDGLDQARDSTVCG